MGGGEVRTSSLNHKSVAQLFHVPTTYNDDLCLCVLLLIVCTYDDNLGSVAVYSNIYCASLRAVNPPNLLCKEYGKLVTRILQSIT
jgi:hypothetical protein